MPKLIRLGPEPWSPEFILGLQQEILYLLEPDPYLEERLKSAQIDYRKLGNSPIPEHAKLISPRSSLEDLVTIVDRLLGPGGCPWDQKQTHASLTKYLLEETYEVIDAIESGDDEKFCEELGDLILQPVMHGQIKKLAGGFDTSDAAQGIIDKLVRRHPHVFGDVSVNNAEEVLVNWDKIKQTEKGETKASLLQGVPKSMAALLRAHEVSKRAARAGFEWPNIEAVFDKLHEEEAELVAALKEKDAKAIESELGDLLFTAVNIARWAGVEPEEALRKMLNRFTERFQHMEAVADRDLNQLSPEAWEELWVRAKSITG